MWKYAKFLHIQSSLGAKKKFIKFIFGKESFKKTVKSQVLPIDLKTAETSYKNSKREAKQSEVKRREEAKKSKKRIK